MVKGGDHMTRKPDAKKNKAKKGTQQHGRYRGNDMHRMEVVALVLPKHARARFDSHMGRPRDECVCV